MSDWAPNTESNTPSLAKEELLQATKELSLTAPYPKVNRKFVDTAVAGEPKFALFSYIPTKNSKPDEDGFYGFAKVRGCYHTIEEAQTRAETIVRDIDSTNSIFTCRVGAPFPICTTGHAETVDEIDLRQKTEDTISQNVRARRRQDQKEMDEIKAKEEELKADVTKGPDPEEDYITHRVKLANLKFMIHEHEAKKQECEKLRDTCLAWLLEAKKENPDYETKYMDKYMESRRKANIPDDSQMSGFMNYMRDPLE